jgi:hypothetical protein
MKRTLLFCITWALASFSLTAQNQINYNDFQGNAYHYFGKNSGLLDSIFINPKPDSINPSALCARYRRDSLAFDFITFLPMGCLSDLDNYAKHDSLVKKFKMKLFSTAPVGTFIELQLGSTKDSSYPSGIHSQYQALTTKSQQWEEIVFNFSQIPASSNISAKEVDKITILFYPYSLSRDTFYFDDFIGPELLPLETGLDNTSKMEDELNFQVFPNPARNSSSITFSLSKTTKTTIKLYNSLGKEVQQICQKNFPSGKHQLTLNLSELPEGIYYCCIDDEEKTSVEKLVILK